MRPIPFLFTMFLLASCASRTDYQPFTEDEGGYRAKKIEGDVQLVNFVGNEHTKKNTAILFASFRAIETCKEQGKGLTHLLYAVGDIEKDQEIHSYPTYYGPSPYFAGFGFPGTAFAGSYGAVGGYYGYGYAYGYPMGRKSYVDTTKYPEATVVYECVEKVFSPKIEFVEDDNDELKKKIKGERTGLLVKSVPQDSPNVGILRPMDLIKEAKGKRLLNVHELGKLFGPDQKFVEVSLIRRGRKMKMLLGSVETTREAQIYQEDVIRRTCQIEDFDHKLCKD